MPAVNASVALTTARTLLNDDAGNLFTDAVLLPKLVQAFRMMVTQMRISAASLLFAHDVSNIGAGVATLTIADINEPIKLWEKAQGAGNDTYVPITEVNDLPNKLPATTVRYWNWDGTQINFIPASVSRTIKTMYWRVLAEPTAAGSSLQLINAEYFLAPATAALAAGALGESEMLQFMKSLADDTFKMIMDANRGQFFPPPTTRP